MPFRKYLRQVRIFFRRLKYRAWNVHWTSYLADRCHIHPSLKMGAYGYIGPGAVIPDNVVMGNYVMISQDLLIVGDDHNFETVGVATIFSGRPDSRHCVIEDDVWIGARVILLRGIRVGRGSVIAAGTVVTKDVPPYSVMAGCPARFIRPRFDSKSQQLHDEFLDRPIKEGQYAVEK